MNKLSASAALLATTLAACKSESGLRPLNEYEPELFPLDPLTETTPTLPAPDFSELIKNCITLLREEESGCPTPDPQCVRADNETKAKMVGILEAAAQEASGDENMTLEGIENGADLPPASTYSHFVLSEGDDYGQPIWSSYGYTHISFGEHEQAYKAAYENEGGFSNFEAVEDLVTISCHAQAYSLEGPEQLTYEQAYVRVTEADGAEQELSIYDFSSSDQVEVNGKLYDLNGSNLDFASTWTVLDSGAEGGLEAARKLAGDKEDKNERVHQY